MTSSHESRSAAAATAAARMRVHDDVVPQPHEESEVGLCLLAAAVEDLGADNGSGRDEITCSRLSCGCCCYGVSSRDDDHDATMCTPHLSSSCCRVALREARILLLELALPTVLIQFATAFPAFYASSFVGRNYGYLYLGGFTLANLTTNLFTMSLLQGLYTASDTLGPAYYAVRSTQNQLGVLAVRGFVLSLAVAIPVAAILVTTLPSVLQSWGEDPAVSTHAVLWYRVTSLSLPFYAAVTVVYKFLAAQRRLAAVVVVLGVSSVVVLPICVRGTAGLTSWGFAGTAWAVTAFQATEAALLLLYLWLRQPHDPETWISWKYSWSRAVSDRRAIWTYLKLGLGGIMASTSWVYWETICLLVGSRMGPLALSAHCVACQVLCLLYMLPQGVGVAIALRVSSVVASSASSSATRDTTSTPRPEVLVWVCLVASTIVFGLLSISLYVARDWVLRLFTTEDVLLNEARSIWGKVCWYNFNTSMFGIHFGIATALGMQRLMGLVTVVALWAMAFPVMYWFAFTGQGDLGTVWSCLWPPYLAINFTMFLVLITRDWEKPGAHSQVDDFPNPSLDALETSLLAAYSGGPSDEETAIDDAI